ncbi:16S rRNA (uracil(1498)-N(3))-methyltransferase|uniref:Ribosomal RNA small subunit methyltransferase E n=1 Tax=Dendrosporobacter quercicolus TaxID=146817 RepID=A0A1G9MSU8_9FIRM|nr:16S rRNA (uracil(1498)-N(3))-methyltransferase [Dendrosporobacter quercicolus]NSL47128.1 16S rRNA (uracil(1498)-N(3))-methyltransferase [Dendrosporobacter quercicolus DSM 1736]SDL77289.1 16S rRNA (uracil1498-N3)-methyltransferase [Dendrosporobacter quercicolus]
MRRFFLPGPLTPEVVIKGADARHISRVLRMKPADEIVVVSADGQAGIAEITRFNEHEVTALLQRTIAIENEPPVQVLLAQCLPKGDKMDYIVQKAVELGVEAIYPVAAEHSVVKYDQAKRQARRQRWQKIAGEAAKQCQRSTVPEVKPIQGLAELFNSLDDDVTVLMLYEGLAPMGIKEFLTKHESAGSYLLLIGPEGGFSTAETDFCRRNDVRFLTMGPRILRTETAALTALGIVLYEKGDLGGYRESKN